MQIPTQAINNVDSTKFKPANSFKSVLITDQAGNFVSGPRSVFSWVLRVFMKFEQSKKADC